MIAACLEEYPMHVLLYEIFGSHYKDVVIYSALCDMEVLCGEHMGRIPE